MLVIVIKLLITLKTICHLHINQKKEREREPMVSWSEKEQLAVKGLLPGEGIKVGEN